MVRWRAVLRGDATAAEAAAVDREARDACDEEQAAGDAEPDRRPVEAAVVGHVDHRGRLDRLGIRGPRTEWKDTLPERKYAPACSG